MRLRVLLRLLQIQRVLVRHRLDDFVRATHLYRPLRVLRLATPWTWFQRSAGATRGERLRLALEELGPIFVKFGQALSTRRDLLPPDTLRRDPLRTSADILGLVPANRGFSASPIIVGPSRRYPVSPKWPIPALSQSPPPDLNRQPLHYN